MSQDLDRQIFQMLSDVTAIPVDEIALEHTLGDLGMDSVACLELMAMLDEQLGVEIELEDAQRLTDVRGVVALARERVSLVG